MLATQQSSSAFSSAHMHAASITTAYRAVRSVARPVRTITFSIPVAPRPRRAASSSLHQPFTVKRSAHMATENALADLHAEILFPCKRAPRLLPASAAKGPAKPLTPASERNFRDHAFARLLLNRAHVRPMHRPLPSTGPKTYVPSRLSCVIAAEDVDGEA